MQFVQTRFPNFQIVATTHSPLTVHQAGDGELFFLRRRDPSVPAELHAYEGAPRDLMLHQLLTSPLFGLTSLDSRPVEQMKNEYRALRDRCWPAPRVPAFFLSMRGTRLHSGHVRETFRDLRQHAGISAAPGARQPRVHDLRHSFAVATLVDWYRSDADVAARLPRLSSYLGHAAPEATYYYLQATPELLALAAERVERLEARS